MEEKFEICDTDSDESRQNKNAKSLNVLIHLKVIFTTFKTSHY